MNTTTTRNLSLLEGCRCSAPAVDVSGMCEACDAEVDRMLRAAAQQRHAATMLDLDAEGDVRTMALFGDRVPMDAPAACECDHLFMCQPCKSQAVELHQRMRAAQMSLHQRQQKVPHDLKPRVIAAARSELKQPLPDYTRPPRARLSWWPAILMGLAMWAVLGALAYALGMFDAHGATLMDTAEADVAAYLQANPSIADQMPAERPHKAPMLGFASEGGRNVQTFMTALMLLDTAQTVVIAQTPQCLREGNNIASAAFGSDQPSAQRVLLTNAAYIIGHWALGAYLDRKAQRSNEWGIARRAYQVLTILGHGWAVKENHRLGIRPFSAYDCDGRQL